MSHINFYLIVLLIASLAACAQQETRNQEPLYQQFTDYKWALDSGRNEREYFSSRLWAALEKTRSQPDEEQGMANIFLKFPNEMIEITGSYESISGDSGCLMVMGLNDKQTPTDYYVTFVHNNNRWVFDEIQVKYYFDGTKRFLKEAVCDEDRQQQLWIEYMEAGQGG